MIRKDNERVPLLGDCDAALGRKVKDQRSKDTNWILSSQYRGLNTSFQPFFFLFAIHHKSFGHAMASFRLLIKGTRERL